MGPKRWRWLLTTAFLLLELRAYALDPPLFSDYVRDYGEPSVGFITVDGQGFLYRWFVGGVFYSLVTDRQNLVRQEGRSMYTSGPLQVDQLPQAAWLKATAPLRKWKRKERLGAFSWVREYAGGVTLEVEYQLVDGKDQPVRAILTYYPAGSGR